MQAKLDRARRGARRSWCRRSSGSQRSAGPRSSTVVGPAGVGKTRLAPRVRGVRRGAARRSSTGVVVDAWPTATPRTRRSPTRSRRSARSSRTTPPRSCGRRSRKPSRSCSATPRSCRRSARWWGSASPARTAARSCSTPGGGSSSGWRRATRWCCVFEDIHWADDGLLDFIEYLGDWAQGPILTVALARPELFERRPTWGGGKRNAVSICARSAVGGRERRRCSTICSRAACPRISGAWSRNGARGTRCSSRRSSAS